MQSKNLLTEKVQCTMAEYMKHLFLWDLSNARTSYDKMLNIDIAKINIGNLPVTYKAYHNVLIIIIISYYNYGLLKSFIP